MSRISDSLRRMTIADIATWTLGLAGITWITWVMSAADRIGGADAPHLVSTELRLAQLVLDGEVIRALRLGWGLIAPHPPLGAVPGAVLGVLTGAAPWSAHATMGVALVFAFDAYVRLARRFTGAPWAALAAGATLLGSPFLWSGLEQHARDLYAGVAALQAVSWAASEGGLATRRNAVGFGLAIAAAFGVKYTAPVFVVGACLLVGARLVVRRDAAAWKGLGLALGIFGATAGVWYAVHGAQVRNYLSNSVDPRAMAGNAQSLRDTGSLEVMFYYPATLWEAMSAPGVALVLVGLIAGFWGRDRRWATALVAVTALVGVAVLARVSQQVDRYALPALVLFAALVLPVARSRIGLVLVVLLAAPRLHASYERFRPERKGVPEAFEHPRSVFGAAQYPITELSWFPSSFDRRDWNLDGIVAALRAAQGDSGTVGLLVPVNPGWPAFGHLSIAAARAGARWDWATINQRVVAAHSPAVFLGPLLSDTWPSPAYEHLVAFEGGGDDAGVREWLGRHPLQVVSRVKIPRGGEAVIYAARPDQRPGPPHEAISPSSIPSKSR